MKINKLETLTEIKRFLDGYNEDLKYVVNVETNPNFNYADCIVHVPGEEVKMVKIRYTPFIYMKDLSKTHLKLYPNKSKEYIDSMRIKYGITETKLKTGNQERLNKGYCYKLSSTKSFNSIINYLRDGGIHPYEKLKDEGGNVVTNDRGDNTFMYRDYFYSVRTTEQFFISTKSRLYKGIEMYKDIHKMTFDIETTGLRYEISRIFSIGVRDNRGFEMILEVDKEDDDESEIRLIQDFFNIIQYIKPAIISGYYSEMFDFEFIIGRAGLLNMDLKAIETSLNKERPMWRRKNSSVKYGSTSERYTSTEMWGISVIDIIHAVKKTIAVNSNIKNSRLEYIAEYEGIAKENRMRIDGEDNGIGKLYSENKYFVINEVNEYLEIPDSFQEVSEKLFVLQANKNKLSTEQYQALRTSYYKSAPKFPNWLREHAVPNNMTTFTTGKAIVRQYLLDDLWETEQVDELYNQSSFMLAKIVPTTYQRVCTMGTAAIWDLLMTAWSYENDLAIPISDTLERFSGGLARCFRTGYSENIVKIDYASLYPMIQLTHNVFPIFDITNVLKKMLLYLTTTRNIYKKLGNSNELNEEEMILLKELDSESYNKKINNTINKSDLTTFDVKQLPIKILNNTLFGALGSGVAFKWSDNVSAARITTTGRLELRHAIYWFNDYGCKPLLAVTDGVNFEVPLKTTIRVTEDGVKHGCEEGLIEDMWKYGGVVGMDALINKFNNDEMKPPYMSIDNDGRSKSCLNLSRINYALLAEKKDKETGEISYKVKLTGNTIKSKTMPEYIEDFIDKGLQMILDGDGRGFVEYYYDYIDDIRYMQIPLKKIANKSRYKQTLDSYLNRGKDKNGRDKAMQAHMELILREREKIAEELFKKHIDEFDLSIYKKELTIKDKMNLVSNYMPQEPELDSLIYYVNIGYRKSHGDSKTIKNKDTGEDMFCSQLISVEDLNEKPDMIGEYNYEKYIDNFNKRVSVLLAGFDDEVAKRIIVKIDKDGNLVKDIFTNEELELKSFEGDSLEDTLYLEELEIDFWNKTGYDPKLIWDGFKERNDIEKKIQYEVYDHALNHLNSLMLKSGNKKIKSINDVYEINDLILLKNREKFSVGQYNGEYIKIVRSNVDIPTKSSIEEKIIENTNIIDKKIKQLEPSELTMEDNVDLSEERVYREKMFKQFKDEYGIPMNATMEQVFSNIENSEDAFEDFLYENKTQDDYESIEYMDID